MTENLSYEARLGRMIAESSDGLEDWLDSEREATRAAVRRLEPEQKERLLDMALQIVQSDNAVFDDRRLAGRFVNVVLDAMDSGKGGIFSRDGDGEVIALSARRGATSLGIADFSRTQIAQALTTGEVITPPSDGYSASAPSSIRHNVPGPSIVVPILAPAHDSDAGRPFAAMCLVRNEGEAPFHDEEPFLELVAKVISPLLHRSQLHRTAVDELQRVEHERNSLRSQNEELQAELRRRDSKDPGFAGFVGRRSRAIRRCLDRAKVAAGSRTAPIIILGETGAGKGRIAKAIHRSSPRRDGLFKSVNCAALAADGNSLNSELFGHVKGAYTGADRDRPGVFRVAQGGTVLLDEVTELTPDAQAKLLRVLQEKVVTPFGSDEDVEVDVRVLVATNKDIEKEVAKGRFRDDLYSRLKVITLVIPSLRERKDDIPELALHFLEERAKEEEIKNAKGLSREAMKELREYRWPDNVRGLENAMHRLLLFTRGRRITGEDVKASLSPVIDPIPREEKLPWTKERLLALLEAHDWNVTKAYKAASISRSYIYLLMEQHGVKRPEEKKRRKKALAS